MPKAVDIYVL